MPAPKPHELPCAMSDPELWETFCGVTNRRDTTPSWIWTTEDVENQLERLRESRKPVDAHAA